MMKTIYQLVIAGLVCMGFASCEKVINVKLKNSDPKIVITGAITNTAGPYMVSVKKSVNFDQNNTFPEVNDAVVVVRDDLGNTDTFASVGNGNYLSTSTTGVPGRTYTLNVVAEGQQYSGTSTMPQPVLMDSLEIIEETGFGDPQKLPMVHYSDPVGVSNYYYFKEMVNGELVKTIYVRSDRVSDGKRAEVVLRDTDKDIVTGDVVEVELQCLDKGVYDYFNTLKDVDGSTRTAAPADPLSNLSNGALGYFSAQTVDTKSVTVK